MGFLFSGTHCIVGISTALCGTVFDGQVFLVKIPPWGKLLQFSWGKLLHGNCHTWDMKLASKQPDYSFHQVLLIILQIHHIYAFLHDNEVQTISFITAVEINVHNFHLHLMSGQTSKKADTNKQTNTMAHTYPHRHM